MSDQKKLDGPDFAQGVALADIEEGGMILGHVTDDAVLLARCGQELFAIGAECTHYHGPLAEGILVEDTVRCPWHHACFSLRTGEAVRAPALNPVACWRVQRLTWIWVSSPALSTFLQFLRAHLLGIVMASGLGFHRAFLHPAPRDIATSFLRYPNHVLQGTGRDLSVDPRARSKIDIDIDPGQKVIAR